MNKEGGKETQILAKEMQAENKEEKKHWITSLKLLRLTI